MRKKNVKILSLALAIAFVLSLMPTALAATDPAETALSGDGIYVSVDDNMSMTVYREDAEGVRTPMTEKPTTQDPATGNRMFASWDNKLPWSAATGTSGNTDFLAASAKLLSDKSGYVTTGSSAADEVKTDDFVKQSSVLETNVSTYFGIGDRLTVTGWSDALRLTRILVIETASDLPGTVSVTSKYRYDGEGTALNVYKFVENNFKINDPLPQSMYIAKKREAGLWSYQGAALCWGADQVVPVFDTIGTRSTTAPNAEKAATTDLVSRNNWFWGENGGTPYNDFYGTNVGIGVGSAMPYQVRGMQLPTRGSGITGEHDTAYTWIGWPGATLQKGALTNVGYEHRHGAYRRLLCGTKPVLRRDEQAVL